MCSTLIDQHKTFDVFRCYDANGKLRLGIKVWQVTSIAERTKTALNISIKGRRVQATEYNSIVTGNLTTIQFLLALPDKQSIDDLTHSDIICEVLHTYA